MGELAAVEGAHGGRVGVDGRVVDDGAVGSAAADGGEGEIEEAGLLGAEGGKNPHKLDGIVRRHRSTLQA